MLSGYMKNPAGGNPRGRERERRPVYFPRSIITSSVPVISFSIFEFF